MSEKRAELRPDMDVYGSSYRSVLDPELAEGFGIYSCGQDGVSSSKGNDKDDLNPWSKGSPWLAYCESPWRRENLRSLLVKLGVIILAVATAAALIWKAAKAETRPRS
jgi:hypothetical protein